ncbi:MAG TPA: S8 family peptidase [Blastocatellia bacterium]|nr:S8 family peptidase [Blastocatellia bacterium]
MKRYLALSLALVFALFCFVPGLDADSEKRGLSRPRYVPGQILVKLRDDLDSASSIEQVADRMLPIRGARIESIDGDERRGRREPGGLYLVQLDGSASVEDAIRRAQADPRVEYAEPNYLARLAVVTPNDDFFSQMWGLQNLGLDPFGRVGKPGADIAATRAWDVTTGNNTVVVAVIDTGLDTPHPDLAANVWVNPNEVAGDGADNDGNGFVDDVNGWSHFSNNNSVLEDGTMEGFGHGTHVSGTIGAVGNNEIGVAGVAWNVKLMGLRAFGRDSQGEATASVADLVKAVNYVTAQKKNGVNVRVINASWGGTGDAQSLRNAIKKAGQQGILFVCAAGNEPINSDSDPQFPASWSATMSNVISVAALDRMDTISSFSTFGHSTISVAAPGQDIISTFPGGGYAQFHGTSQATPHVSGIAALLWSNEPGLTPAQVKDRIIRTAEPVLSVASKLVSSGRANAFNALTNAIPPMPEIGLVKVSNDKKTVTVDGLGIISQRLVVEVNGVALPGQVSFDSAYSLPNGSFTRAKVKVGKAGVQANFPAGIPVQVTLFDPVTSKRSNAVSHTRFFALK